ncbi:permease-like cell division protein FtsX [Marinobacter daepoensis]|uniref:Cell division protein FtsX n=1 Tax=Marinobacter daepoensis TaxID=262077 RepID=A0ABS3BA65_9GAMM|nr:permease-like cell division protein FtsX [Marinobacter daepoensis]MBN7768418.1 permease-like cell division protein FtsX [Marinobacter daepoensis]MBY6034559.1 permease-like cell division protein FtsX [Marinobacter daepoensis]MBY6080719.1 permease-like cell division protein FtsX [Marinobacter daepoensis]
MATDSRQKPDGQRGANRARSVMGDQARSYLGHHRKVARDSMQRLWASPVASAMTWAVMGVALALPVALLLLLSSLQGVSAGWESTARITAYLDLDLPLSDARNVAREIGADGRVMTVQLVERDQALEEFRASSGLNEALDFLEENPLPHTLLVTPEDGARSADGVQALVTFVEKLRGVDQVQVDLGWLQRLNAMTDILARAVWALALLLGGAVILVIGNTVRLAIESRRDEILVAKLVGGTDAFVRRPFLYTGAWFGLGGGIVAWLLIQISLWWLSGPIERLAGLYRSEFTLQGPGVDGALALIIVAMLLGWLGAWVAVKRHLDDIEPGDIAGG